MIDYGLLVSMIIGFGVPALLVNRWRLSSYDEPVGFLDVALGPAMAGLAAGRLTALALDDAGSIGSISDMLIIRSGVEFWPGVAAAMAVLVWGARRAGLSPLTRLADLTALAMVGYAGYESACVFRDGCFGPHSPLGLRPPGLTTTMLPIGWLMAGAVVVAAIGVRQLSKRSAPSTIIVLAAALAVAATRAIGSIWLPHVGDGLTRQHVSSIGIAAASTIGLVVVVVATRQRAGDPSRA